MSHLHGNELCGDYPGGFPPRLGQIVAAVSSALERPLLPLKHTCEPWRPLNYRCPGDSSGNPPPPPPSYRKRSFSPARIKARLTPEGWNPAVIGLTSNRFGRVITRLCTCAAAAALTAAAAVNPDETFPRRKANRCSSSWRLVAASCCWIRTDYQMTRLLQPRTAGGRSLKPSPLPGSPADSAS